MTVQYCISVGCRISGQRSACNKDNMWSCENNDSQLVCWSAARRLYSVAALLGPIQS